MMHRIRFAMTDGHSTPEKLTGTIEVDEAFVSGKPRWNGRDKRKTRLKNKTPIVAILQRNSEARAMVVPKVNAKNLAAVINQNIDKSARLITDKAAGKKFKGGHYPVNHSQHEYAR